MECIICRLNKNTEDFNIEHVIPEVLGGVYTIKTVCVKCNSSLGNRVDIKIISELSSIFYREKNNIKGKSGKLPSFLTGTFNNCLDEKEKYRVERDENNKLTFRFIDDVEVTENGSNKFNIKIKIDESVKNKKHYLDRLLNKKIERMKLSNVKIKKTSFEIRQSNIMISANVFVSSTDSFIAILKMAYEFAVSNISDYINDKEAKAISKTLETADLKKAMKYVNGSSSLLRNEDVVGLNKIFAMNNVHFFIVNNFQGKLGCLVFLKEIGSYAVTLSQKTYPLNDALILINDVERKTCEIDAASNIVKNNSDFIIGNLLRG